MDNALLDRLIIYVLCISIYLMRVNGYYAVVPILVALTADALCGWFKNARIKRCCFIGFAVLCVFRPEFILLLPVLSYEVPLTRKWWLFLSLIPVCSVISKGNTVAGAFTLLFIVFAAFMKYRTAAFEKAKSDYINLRDTTKELSMRLSDKNKELRGETGL